MDGEEVTNTLDPTTLGKRKRSLDDTNTLKPKRDSQNSTSIAAGLAYTEHQTSVTVLKKQRVSDIQAQDLTSNNAEHGERNLAKFPPEVLQYIFSFVDPISLGRLMCLNRTFRTLLDPRESLSQISSYHGFSKIQKQDSIWTISRRLALPGFLRPMKSMTELDMWKLIRGRRCHYCGKLSKTNLPNLATSPWTSGPGSDGVRAIWPFRVRVCGRCLESRLVKELDILITSSSPLLPGLPFALFTPRLDYISNFSAQQSQVPSDVQLSKYYFRPQVDDLISKFQEVQAHGPATVEEWIKGLESTGKSSMNDAGRFEQWEWNSSNQVQSQVPINTKPKLETFSLPPRPDVPAVQPGFSSTEGLSLGFSSSFARLPGLGPPPSISPGSPAPGQQMLNAPAMPLQHIGPAPGQDINLRPQPSSSSSYAGSRHAQHVSPSEFAPSPQPVRQRRERTQRDNQQMRLERRIDIERRCMELFPPIKPSTLVHMQAFQAAIQISMPLNDNGWETLKERLLDEREDAEKKEDEHHANSYKLGRQHEDPWSINHTSQSSRGNIDKVWNTVQRTAREKLKYFAEEHLHNQWSDGCAVTRINSSKFAADLLVLVKTKFDQSIAQENVSFTKLGLPIPPDIVANNSGNLKLEDMRWVYEQYVKPFTERYDKDIFLCNGCDNNNKYFSFEAVIQHFAAKHTHELSHGNIVVYWKADWPRNPPFRPSSEQYWPPNYDHQPGQSSAFSSSPAYSSRGLPSYSLSLAPGQPNGIYQVQCDELVNQVLDIWLKLDSILTLPDSVRLSVVILHVARRFKQKFTNEPTLSLFNDCIHNKSALKTVREIQNLQCKACRTSRANLGLLGFTSTRSVYELPELLKHFQKTHIETGAHSPQSTSFSTVSRSSVDQPKLDWKYDMIDLPSAETIRGILQLPGIESGKLGLIAEVMPGIFYPSSSGHDVTAHISHPRTGFTPEQGVRNHVHSDDNVNVDGQRYSSQGRFIPDPNKGSEDEYDPHRPAPAILPYRGDRTRSNELVSPNMTFEYPIRGYPTTSPITLGQSETRPFFEDTRISSNVRVYQQQNEDLSNTQLFHERDLHRTRETLSPDRHHRRFTTNNHSEKSVRPDWNVRAGNSPQQAPNELAAPAVDHSNVVENFLNSFDIPSGESLTQTNTPTGEFDHRLGARPERNRVLIQEPNGNDHQWHSQSWQADKNGSSNTSNSRYLSPQPSGTNHYLSANDRQVSVLEDRFDHVRQSRHPSHPHSRPDYEMREVGRANRHPGNREDLISEVSHDYDRDRMLPDDLYRRGKSHYDDLYLEHRTVERRPLDSYTLYPPEAYRRQYIRPEPRYYEVLPTGERRYLEELELPYEPAEYVRVRSRDFGTIEERYHNSRPPHENPIEDIDHQVRHSINEPVQANERRFHYHAGPPRETPRR